MKFATFCNRIIPPLSALLETIDSVPVPDLVTVDPPVSSTRSKLVFPAMVDEIAVLLLIVELLTVSIAAMPAEIVLVALELITLPVTEAVPDPAKAKEAEV